ncbi:MAG: hypothetical protein WAK53_13720 [Chromatiaceae bacterium]
MSEPRAFLGLIPVLALAFLFTGTAQAGQCETIRFKHGESSGTVTGMAPPDDVVCYQMSTVAGQQANVTIKGTNCIFSIEGVVDAQDRYSFTTEKKTYKINVGQLMRAVAPERFTLSVSVH